MIGIYKYENKINGHCYIGQSVDLERRHYGHKYAAFNEQASDYNSQFHQAVRKYGWENFDYSVLIELSSESYTHQQLDELEKAMIEQYDSYHNGYNATPGGTEIGNTIHSGESNGRALLTEKDVIYIRECYNAHIPFRVIYDEYKDKISKRGLQKVWWFETWKNILPEYCTEENKYWHSHNAKANSREVAANNKRSFTEDEIRKMRAEYNEGATPKQIWLKYAPEKAYSTVYNVVTGATYKDII